GARERHCLIIHGRPAGFSRGDSSRFKARLPPAAEVRVLTSLDWGNLKKLPDGATSPAASQEETMVFATAVAAKAVKVLMHRGKTLTIPDSVTQIEKSALAV
ncbi:unnamed protein product, partial [Cladocopium goreaui]